MSDYTQTPNLHLYKPTYGADYDQWGNHLNSNADALDSAFSAAALNAQNYGAVGDSITDNTTALQAAINAAQSLSANTGTCTRLMLPKGVYVTGPLSITGQLCIASNAGNSGVLRLKAGSTAPLITISNSGAWTTASPFNEVRFTHVRLESQDGKGANTTAHGIQINSGGAGGLKVTLENTYIYNMPANGVNSGGLNGWVDFIDVDIRNNGGHGVNANSVNDWHWYGGAIASNGQIGVLLAGSSQCCFYGTNIFYNGTNNVQCFSAAGTANGQHNFFGCMFDGAAQHGFMYGMAGSGNVVCWGCTFSNCSIGSPNVYSDCFISSSANSNLVLKSCIWQANNAQNPTYNSQYTLGFQGTGNTVTMDGQQILLGPSLSTNGYAQILGLSNVRGYVSPPGGLNVVAPTQFTGLAVMNTAAGNVVAKLQGIASNNDNGELILFSGGTAVITLSAGSGNATAILRPTQITSLIIGAVAGPTIASGTGAATGTQPAGSLFLRTDGATGTRLYVSAGGGTWNAVAGV